MVKRIVRMHFYPEQTGTFEQIFNASKDKIRASKGCLGLKLYTDHNLPEVYYTWSTWESEEDLQRYRQSELFKSTWEKTKILFKEKAVAWTLNPHDNLK
jgi:quinol monooxygenase YgiN